MYKKYSIYYRYPCNNKYYIDKYVNLYIYSSKHTLIRWCAAGSYAVAAGRAVPTSTLSDRKIFFLN